MDNAIQLAEENLYSAVAELTAGIKDMSVEDQIASLHQWEGVAGKVKLWLIWLLYSSGMWLKVASKQTEQGAKMDFRFYIESVLHPKGTELHGMKTGYGYQNETILRVLCWTFANWVELNGKRITVPYLIGSVPITQFLQYMSIWNNADSDQERAWCVYQWARGEQVTPLRDMVFAESANEAETVEDETEDEEDDEPIKPKAVLKIDSHGNLTVKVTSPDMGQIADIKDALANIVEWI